MCGDTKPRGKSDFDVGEMGPTIDALRGVVIVSGYEEVDFCCGVGGELVAVMCNVVALREVCDAHWFMVASCCVERLLKCV